MSRCPHGNGEQRLNALPIVQRGGGLLVDDAELTAEWIKSSLLPVLTNIDQVAGMSEAAAAMGRKDADRWLAKAVIDIVAGRGRQPRRRGAPRRAPRPAAHPPIQQPVVAHQSQQQPAAAATAGQPLHAAHDRQQTPGSPYQQENPFPVGNGQGGAWSQSGGQPAGGQSPTREQPRDQGQNPPGQFPQPGQALPAGPAGSASAGSAPCGSAPGESAPIGPGTPPAGTVMELLTISLTVPKYIKTGRRMLDARPAKEGTRAMALVTPTEPVPLEELGRVHFVGIGGAGMSGIARIMLARGVEVSGSDTSAESAALAELAALGARVHVGHAAGQLGDADTLVVSSAIRADNPELVEANSRGLRVVHRAAALASLMFGRRVIAVTGTHGKTSTTSMITTVLLETGADPAYAIGGVLAATGIGAADGERRLTSSPRRTRATARS